MGPNGLRGGFGSHIARVESTDHHVAVHFEIDGDVRVKVRVDRSIETIDTVTLDPVEITWGGTSNRDIAYAQKFREALGHAIEVVGLFNTLIESGPVEIMSSRNIDGVDITAPLVHGQPDYILCLAIMMLGGTPFYLRERAFESEKPRSPRVLDLDGLRSTCAALVMEAKASV